MEHIRSQTTVVYILAPGAHEVNKQGEDPATHHAWCCAHQLKASWP